MSSPSPRTIWVFGDQLNRGIGPIKTARPGVDRILLVESIEHVARRPWHRQRAHLIISSMRRFAAELTAEGFEVDMRRAADYADGLAAHRVEYAPGSVIAMAPSSIRGRRLIASLDVELTPDERFLTQVADFEALFAGKKRRTMETFYHWQRRRLNYLMDGDEPVTGRWNYDEENRKGIPKGAVEFPDPISDDLDDLDAAVLADLPESLVGGDPLGFWPTSREGALRRLRHAIDVVLPQFGQYEDAMTKRSWHLAHTLLSPALNLGLLHPREVADEIEVAYRAGRVDIASAEGLLRQIIGWREYVWCTYWHEGEAYLEHNALDARRALPPVFTGAPTDMACIAHALADVEKYGWTHHIPRLMVLGNLTLIAGVEPRAIMDWMWERYVDGAEWVMAPNVIGMSQYADGGVMATKPYAAGGAYIDRMGDFCGDCAYNRKLRTGDDACPFTTLYWDFTARHADRFAKDPRMARQVAAARRLNDLDAVRARATEVLERLDRGAL